MWVKNPNYILYTYYVNNSNENNRPIYKGITVYIRANIQYSNDINKLSGMSLSARLSRN